MALLIGIQVFCRYGLNYSLFWAEEVGRICLAWITFLGATTAYAHRQHVGVDFVTRRLPTRLKRVTAFIVWAASMAFFGTMLVYGICFIAFVSGQRTAALALPMAVPYGVIPVSGAVFILHGLNALFDLGRESSQGE